jgi:Zn-dependent protease with chaperone function
LQLLLAAYPPFLLLVTLGLPAAAVNLILLAKGGSRAGWAGAFLLGLAGFDALAAILYALGILWAFKEKRDPLELRVKRPRLEGLYALADEVARRRGLEPPDEIRLGADTVAHVYEDKKGREILVIGGGALAAFSRESLAGIIAHELGHFAAGDTRLARQAHRWHQLMACLDAVFAAHPWTYANPLAWLIRAYHWVYGRVWARNSRNQEFAADHQEVALVGKEAAAAALVKITVAQSLPWLRLTDMVEAGVQLAATMPQLFAEQAERIRDYNRQDWQEACRKALRKATGPLDSHPALRDRLAAMGVSAAEALHLPPEPPGPRACRLIPEWEAIQKELAEKIVAIYRAQHHAKMEIAQIFRGRPV